MNCDGEVTRPTVQVGASHGGCGIGEHMKSKEKTTKTLELLDGVHKSLYNIGGKEENSVHNYECGTFFIR
jgi:hypothetical protein